MTQLQLLRLAIGCSRQSFKEWKPNPMAPHTRYLSRASGKLTIIARDSDWFIVLLSPVVIARTYSFGIDFSTVISKQLYVD